MYNRCAFRICNSQHVTFTSNSTDSIKSGSVAVFTSAGVMVSKGVRVAPGETVSVPLLAEDPDGNGVCTDYYAQVGCCCDLNDCIVSLTIAGSIGESLSVCVVAVVLKKLITCAAQRAIYQSQCLAQR